MKNDWLRRYMKMADDGGGVAGAPPSGGSGDSGGGSVSTPSAPSVDGGGGDTGGAAAPASPASPPAMDWSALGSVDDLDYHEIPPVPPAPEPVVKEPPVAPVVPPPAVPPAQQPTPTPPAAEGQPPTAGAERPLTAADPWRIADGLEAHRAEVLAHLAQTKFALSEEDIRDLDTDVTTAVPKLLSRVFLEGQMAMQRFLAQAVPGMLKQYNTVTSANDAAENKFFDMHKALDKNNPQHRAAAVRIASIYRQANPNIPLDQLIAEVGPMVMAAVRVSGQPAASAAPAALPRGGTPFRPAVNGGGGVSPTSEPPNEWSGLGRDYD